MNCRTARHWLVVDLYDELNAAEKTRLTAHLEKCRNCGAFLTETKRVLDLIDEHSPVPVSAPAPAVEAESVWQRVRAGIASSPRKPGSLPALGRRWAFAGAALAFALVAGIFLGRTWFSPVPVLETEAGPTFDQALAIHLDDAAPVLIDYLHRIENGAGRTVPVEESAVRALLLQNIILRRALVETNPAATELLDDLDLVFKEIVSGGAKASSIQDLIRERNILFRLRILKKDKEINS